jgi:hypothetical protein
VYDDAKDLIEDLITGELAKSAAELFVCFSPDKLTYYFPETLQALHKEDFVNLSSVARKESAAAVGEWVRQSFVDKGTVSLKEMFGGLLSKPPYTAETKDLPFTLAQACAKKVKAAFPIYSADESLKAPDKIDLKGIETDDAVSRKLDESILAASKAERPVGSCGVLYAKPTDALSCELGLAAQAIVLQEEDAVWDHLIGAAVVPLAALHPAAGAPADGGVAGAPTSDAGVGVVPEFYSNWLKLKDALSAFLGRGDAHLPMSQLKQALIEVGLAKPAEVEDVFSTVIVLRQIAAQNLSASSVQQGIVVFFGLAEKYLPSDDLGTKVLDAAKKTVGSAEFTSLLDSLKSGDGHRIVFDAIENVVLLATQQDDKAKAAGKAVLAVLRYASESRSGQPPTAATREAAKSALFDYMSSAGKSGYSSYWPSVGQWLGGEWLTVSLGASFSSGYVNSGHQGLRFPASAEVLTVKFGLRSATWTYFGIHAAAIDLLRPVGEWVLRDQGSEYASSGRVWANFIHPRVDLVLGMPAFSKRLALFAGVGFVLVAPVKTGDGTYEYEWISTGESDRASSVKRVGDFWPRFLDFEVGIRYYPF